MIVNWRPKKIKFKRLHKGVMRRFKHKNSSRSLQQGAIGLRVLKSGQLTGRQLEQARRELVNKKVNKKKKIQKIWYCSMPDVPVTKKPLGIRMGKGKGAVSHWIFKLAAGKIIFKTSWMKRAKLGLRKVAKLLPVPTKIWRKNLYFKKPLKILNYS